MTEMETAARSALETIATSMTNDGYALTIQEVAKGGLAVRIEALEGACEDCLVPRSVMVPMIEKLLNDNGLRPSRVDVAFPNEARDQ